MRVMKGKLPFFSSTAGCWMGFFFTSYGCARKNEVLLDIRDVW